MIILKLYEYYEQQIACNNSHMPHVGFEERSIPFIILLSRDGDFIELEDCRGTSVSNTLFLVPKAEKRRGIKAHERANCLWDHLGYVLGQPRTLNSKDIELANLQHEAFIRYTSDIYRASRCHEVAIVESFLKKPEQIRLVKSSPLYSDALKLVGCNVSFRIEGESHLVCQSIKIFELLNKTLVNQEQIYTGTCLVTGHIGSVARLHDNISGVTDIPAPLISINESSYCSYGKKQAFNSPISSDVALKYTTALNYLLRKGSPNKVSVGGVVIVFWAVGNSTIEKYMPSILAENKDLLRHEIPSDFFDKISSSTWMDSDETCILGLSPNASRISVRFFINVMTKDLIKNILIWLDDIKIENTELSSISSARLLLRHSALLGRSENISSHLTSSIVNSIFNNKPLPDFLLISLLERIRSEHGIISQYRAALIRAWVNRHCGFNDGLRVSVSLNENEYRVGYLAGRLFSLLEWLYYESGSKIRNMFSNEFLIRACYMPESVFGILLMRKKYWCQTVLPSKKRLEIEKAIDNMLIIINRFPCIFPLEQRALFIVGYYHQKQKLKTNGWLHEHK